MLDTYKICINTSHHKWYIRAWDTRTVRKTRTFSAMRIIYNFCPRDQHFQLSNTMFSSYTVYLSFTNYRIFEIYQLTVACQKLLWHYSRLSVTLYMIQPRSQGFYMRTRRDTRKPWSGPVT